MLLVLHSLHNSIFLLFGFLPCFGYYCVIYKYDLFLIVCKNSYKWAFHLFLMDSYEALLDEAYESVEASSECGRFEVLKVKGHHEGVRTIITNFGQIVACIRRKPKHFLKFLTKELASSGEIEGDCLILSRKLASKDVNVKIEKYVNQFVLCPKCKKPDTELEDVGAKTFLRCLACGERREIHRI